MAPQKVDRFVYINKPKYTIERIWLVLKVDQSYKKLRFACNKICESATGANKTWNLQIPPDSNAQVFRLYENNYFKSAKFLNNDKDVSFEVHAGSANSSSQRKADVFIDVQKLKQNITVYLYAAVRPTLTGPFVEKPDDKPFWALACPSEKNNRIKVATGVDWESVGDELRLTVDVTCAKVTKECEISSLPPTTTETVKKSSLVSHIGCLLNNPMNSDVTLRANGQEWKVHKGILSARSPVFAAMFNGGLKESTESSVEFKEVDANAFNLMIQYIYKNELDDMGNLAKELLHLSDRFDLADLKKDCELELIKTLNLDNCLSLLSDGMKVNAESLVKEGKSFISENFLHVCTTKEWKQFAEKNTDLSISLTVASLTCAVNSE